MAKSIPNNNLTIDSQFDFHKYILLGDDGSLIVSIGSSYNPALTPIYNALNALTGDTAQILLDTNQLVLNTADNATETTLNSLLSAFNAEDFATETTLSSIKIDTGKIDVSTAALLSSFNSTDFATETTQSEIKTQTDKLTFTDNRLHVLSPTLSGGTVESTFPDAYFDAFNRLRTSGTGNRLDVEFIYDKQEEIIDEITGGTGSVVHQGDTRDLLIKTNGSGLTDSAAMMSYNIPYTPGNSQLIAITGTLNELDLTGEAEIFFRSKVSGSIVETTYPQSAWTENVVSDADWSKSHILEIDFQSLKVGRMRFYLNRSGIITPIHQITNDNKYNAGYWQLPTLPLGWRIWNDANYTYTEMCYGDEENGIGLRFKTPLNALQQLRAICGTVKSEGGLNLEDITGYNRVADSHLTPKTVSTTLIPLLSIKPKDLFKTFDNHSLIIPQLVSLSVDNPVKYTIVHNAILNGESWVDVDSDESSVEYDVSATSFTNGHVLYSDYISTAKNKGVSASSLLGRALLWARRGDMSGTITIAAIRTGGSNATTYTSLQWKEIR